MTAVDLTLRIYQDLRRQIITGELPAGLQIVEAKVGQLFGASRTPVRSALDRLEQEHYLVATRGNRRYLAALTIRDAQELIAIIAQLEQLAARSATGLPLSQRRLLVRPLRRLNRELRSHKTAQQCLIALDLDRAFHVALVEGVAGRRLLAFHRMVGPHVDRYTRHYTGAFPKSVPDAAREHDDIIEAIADGDPVAAEHAIKVHWSCVCDRLRDAITSTNEHGTWNVADSVAP